jgi:hypothetical protein
VRQTFLRIVEFLNKTYHFVNPIALEHKRIDSYDRTTGKNFSRTWIDITFN